MPPAALLRFALALAAAACASAGCEFYTNCAACVADTTCGWCGNDPYHAGGYGFTLHGDHNVRGLSRALPRLRRADAAQDGNPFSKAEAMGGGLGRVYTAPSGSSQRVPGPEAALFGTSLVFGINTLFTRQFRGFAGYHGQERGAAPFAPLDAGNPFQIAFAPLYGASAAWPLYRVWNDTVLEVEDAAGALPAISPAAAVQFTLATPRGSGGLAFGFASDEVVLPGSGTREQLTVRCVDSSGALVTDPSSPSSCKFAKELKPGYLLVIDSVLSGNLSGPSLLAGGLSVGGPTTAPVRVVTSVISDLELTVDADFNQASAFFQLQAGSGSGPASLSHQFSDWPQGLPYSGNASGAGGNGTAGALIALPGGWTYVSCPPRVGKVANGAGTLLSSWNQGSWASVNASAAAMGIDGYAGWVAGNLATASGGATGYQHRIVGSGTRFASQFGAALLNAGGGGSGGYGGEGPFLSVSINGDVETQRVVLLGSPNAAGVPQPANGYDEYFAVLENSFSEPLLAATPFVWRTMLTAGTGALRSSGRRVVSEEWATIEPWWGVPPRVPGAQFSSQGLAGNTRFLTQLRTGFTITACGQTRTVNSISSDVELSIDRPFSNGNREYYPVSSGASGAGAPAPRAPAAWALSVRGLSRSLPLWPRGVTVQVVVVRGGTAAAGAQFKINVWWKTFIRTDDGDGNALDDVCPGYLPGNGSLAGAASGAPQNALGGPASVCGTAYYMANYSATWFSVNDPVLQQALGVYLKWSGSANYTAGDQWRLHVGDVANCPWLFSREGERFLNDDNANPPLCYNHGSCLPISTGAQSAADGAMRPNATGTGVLASFTPAASGLGGVVTAAPDPVTSASSSFTSSLQAGNIVRAAVPGAPAGDGAWLDMRVSSVISDSQFTTDSALLSGGAYSPLLNASLLSGGGLNYWVLSCAAGRRFDGNASAGGAPHGLLVHGGGPTTENARGLVGDSSGGAYLPHPALSYYQTWSYRYCEIDPGCCGFQVASVVSPQAFGYYSVKPDHGNYNLRIAVFTVNDNLDLYTRRADRGSGRPDSVSYDSTSVRESVPWAIDEDASGFSCAPGLGVHAQGVALVSAGNATLALQAGAPYATALGYPSVSATAADCVPWTVGVMGDNRYPQTVGASEYTAWFYLDFNYASFACADSGAALDDSGLVGDPAARSRCIESGLRLVRDATVLQSAAAAPVAPPPEGGAAAALPAAAGGNASAWVVRLTESMRRSGLGFTPWAATAGPSYPMAQRSGAVWWRHKLHMLDGFETNFVFQVTDPSQCGSDDKICDGGDGFALVLTNDARQENASARFNDGWDCYAAPAGTLGDSPPGRNGCDPSAFVPGASGSYAPNGYPAGLIGCPADGLGYGNSKKSSTVNYFGAWQECQLGLRKSLAVEFDLFYNVERRDPKQGVQHWWINATEYVSYNDNHLGVFSTTEPFYASQPWGASQASLLALHSDDENGAHYGSTPSVLTMADFQQHTVKVRYTRGFSTEKVGSGLVTTTDISSADGDGRRLLGDANTRFLSELRTGFEFGYADRVKANVKIKLWRDASNSSATAPPLSDPLFGDDGVAARVIAVLDDSTANLEESSLAGATAAEQDARVVLQPPFSPSQPVWSSYNIIKEFPGEIQVFIDDMDRYAFQVAVEDRDMAKVLDGDGNAYLGLTASSGSRGFALPGYDPVEIQETHDLLAWNFCTRPGCVPY